MFARLCAIFSVALILSSCALSQTTNATLRGLNCDVFLSSHGFFFDMLGKRARLLAGARPNPFIDPHGCRAFFAKAEDTFDKKLAACKADPACGKKED